MLGYLISCIIKILLDQVCSSWQEKIFGVEFYSIYMIKLQYVPGST